MRWGPNGSLTGTVHKVPVAGSAEWYRDAGKVTVLLPARPGQGLRSWAKVRPGELEVLEPYGAPPPGKVLRLLAIEVDTDRLAALDEFIDEVVEQLAARRVANQTSGCNLTLVRALQALAFAHEDHG